MGWEQRMLDEVDERMRAWVGRVLGEVPVSLEVPDRRSLEDGVNLYLLELGAVPSARTERRPPLQLSACYLVTVGASGPERAHRMLGELAFAAMLETDLEADFSPLPLALWAGLGLPPRPGFRLRAQVRRERPEPALPRVRRPLVLHSAPLTHTLAGQVLGPEDVPVPGAWVELPSLGLRTRTDAQGAFRFEALPPPSTLGRLEVRARGEVRALEAEALDTQGAPLLIRLSFEGGMTCPTT